MTNIVLKLEVDRLNQRIDGLKEWRDQLTERIALLEQKRDTLLQASEDEP